MDIDRIFALHRMLASRRYPVPTRELMAELECSRSTLHRTICHLRDALGAPVLNVSARGYFYDLGAGKFELPGLWFRADELEALLVMDHLLESVQPGVLHAHLDPLRNKVKDLLDRSVQGRSRFRPTESAFSARTPAVSPLRNWSLWRWPWSSDAGSRSTTRVG